MVEIEPLNDAELLRNLNMRFEKDLIYTNIGPTLLILNPMTDKVNPVSKTKEQWDICKNYAKTGNNSSSLMPHIWSITANSFRQLQKRDKDQAICISGESGAGKTVAATNCLHFLTDVMEESINKSFLAGDDNANTSVKLKDKILATTPILETFGNAKTHRNDNSSRFGKYLQIYADPDTLNICGADIEMYLLEKSRVTTQSEKERNYHIFYALCRFAPMELKRKYRL